MALQACRRAPPWRGQKAHRPSPAHVQSGRFRARFCTMVGGHAFSGKGRWASRQSPAPRCPEAIDPFCARACAVDLEESIRHKPRKSGKRFSRASHIHYIYRLPPPRPCTCNAVKWSGLTNPETFREENLSAEQACSQTPPRLPGTHGNRWWPQGPGEPPRAWPQAFVCLSAAAGADAPLHLLARTPCAYPHRAFKD